MKMPDSHQRIPVKVPKVNYSMVTEIAPEEERTTLCHCLWHYWNKRHVELKPGRCFKRYQKNAVKLLVEYIYREDKWTMAEGKF